MKTYEILNPSILTNYMVYCNVSFNSLNANLQYDVRASVMCVSVVLCCTSNTDLSMLNIMKGTKVPNLAVVSKLFINSMPA